MPRFTTATGSEVVSLNVNQRPRSSRTKTIATVGPACSTPDVLMDMVFEGVDVFRLNMAHGNRAEHQDVIKKIKTARKEARLAAGILIDLAGPKIRLGQLHTDPMQLELDAIVTFVPGDHTASACELTCNYQPLFEEVRIEDQIMLADGLVRLLVTAIQNNRITCRVVDGGVIRSRQGVNLPGVSLGIPALLDVDRDNAIWAAKNKVDYVSLSFVRKASEVEELKQLLQQQGSSALVVAKIEKRKALDNLNEIVEASDVIMVARGDLGVEIEIEKTPLAQKRIIKTCQRLGKPVIVATQMLESMHNNRQPTRAEASDVANAILDGADACMLSGETAVGQFPIPAVQMMQKIQIETETVLEGRPSRLLGPEKLKLQGVTEAVILGAAMIAQRTQAKMVVIATSGGAAALIKSKQRDFIPTVAVTDSPSVMNQMSLFWGITPVHLKSINMESLRQWVQDWSKESGELNSGDRVVFVADTELWPGVHDTVMVWSIP